MELDERERVVLAWLFTRELRIILCADEPKDDAEADRAPPLTRRDRRSLLSVPITTPDHRFTIPRRVQSFSVSINPSFEL